jgi:hypothetical protein
MINEFYTSQKCCKCKKDLKHYKHTKGVEIYRLFTCSLCVSCENKNVVFRTRVKNSAINSSSTPDNSIIFSNNIPYIDILPLDIYSNFELDFIHDNYLFYEST